MSSLNKKGSARSTRGRGSSRPSSSNPHLITSFFKATNQTPPEPLVQKNIVISSAPTDETLCTSSSAPEPLTRSETIHTTNNFSYQCHYPKINNFKYNSCRNSNCKTCPAADPAQICNNKTHLIFCKVFNCIYQLTCKKCNQQYIGQTSTHLNLRMNLHRSMSKPGVEKSNTLEIEHFKMHGFNNISIRILDLVPDTKTRLWWENKHIVQFLTSFPYGLNTIIFNKHLNTTFIMDSKNSPVYNNTMQNNNKIIDKNKKRGTSENKNTMDKNINKLKIFMQMNEANKEIPLNWIKNMVFNIKIRFLNKFWFHCSNLINNKNLKPNTTILKILDLTKFRMNAHKLKFENPDIIKNTKYCVVNFTNKIFNSIHVSSIFKNRQHLFPIRDTKLLTAFKYNKPICRRIYNYNSVSKSVHIPPSGSCLCNDTSIHYNSDHGHIITGDTNIVKDKHLKLLMDLGTGFRFSTTNNKKLILKIFRENIESFIYNNAITYSLPLAAFNEWKFYVINDFRDSLNFFPTINHSVNFDRRKAMAAITYLQSTLVISYLDKVTSNYAFTCKFYYCQKLIEVYKNPSLYNKVTTDCTIIKKRIIALYKKVGFNLTKFKFPYLILIPKLHKTPVKFRSVTVGCGTYLEYANTKLLQVIKHIYNHMEKSGGYIIKNSYEAICTLKNLASVSHFKSYDFADLFNSINLKDLKEIMLQAFEKYDLLQFTSFHKYKTFIQIVLSETYISNGHDLFIQKTGIPMGGACSSALADIFLFTYECGTNLNNEISFFRYVDDILICFHTPSSNLLLDFYPPYLTLIETPPNKDGSINFLDVCLNTRDDKVIYKIFNKRDEYNFKINHISNWESNLHLNIFRNLLINFFMRCKKLNSNNNVMNNTVSIFLKHSLLYGFPFHFILKTTTNFFGIGRIEAVKRFSL